MILKIPTGKHMIEGNRLLKIIITYRLRTKKILVVELPNSLAQLVSEANKLTDKEKPIQLNLFLTSSAL